MSGEALQALVQKHLGDITDAMSPLQLLNQTLDRASLTDVQSGTMEGTAITGGDIDRWRGAIESGATDEARWLAAEQMMVCSGELVLRRRHMLRLHRRR